MISAGVAGAILMALCYGVTPACARRSIRLLGFARANLWRLLVALILIGALAFLLGGGVGEQAGAFALAGAIGFGLGGFAMFRALPLLGAPLSSLIVETTAALAAGVLAWVWLADTVSFPVVAFSLLLLMGVVVGLAPYVRQGPRQPRLILGVTFAVVAALAQATSGVLSRRALLAAQPTQVVQAETDARFGASLDPALSAAFERLIGGVLVAVAFLLLAQLLETRAEWARSAVTPAYRGAERGAVWTEPETRLGRSLPDRAGFWVGANALFGPILGVTAMVWALQFLQPGVVQAIAAAALLIAIPSARWLEGYRPPPGFLIGVLLAVLGLAGLALFT